MTDTEGEIVAKETRNMKRQARRSLSDDRRIREKTTRLFRKVDRAFSVFQTARRKLESVAHHRSMRGAALNVMHGSGVIRGALSELIDFLLSPAFERHVEGGGRRKR
jgi:hypothetical protein